MKTIGRSDFIDLPEFGIENIPAKVDTGANRSSLHCTKVWVEEIGNIEWLHFNVPIGDDKYETFKTDDFFNKKIKSSSGHVEERFIIKTEVILFGELIPTTFSLTNRQDMNFPILLGRKLLQSGFIVDVTKTNLSFKQKKRTK